MNTNATAQNRLRYADWLYKLTHVLEFPAMGNRFSWEAQTRRDQKASTNSMSKYTYTAEYE